uniref:Acid phosphatase 1 n=1 Tax=Aegilops tauschii subsp. strangulata TaxID=200361 RepID=A0A453QFL2_AEGTS
MAMATKMLLLLAAVALLVASSGAWEINIHMPTSVATVTAMEEAMAPIIHALRPMLGSGGQLGSRAGVACDSWRLGVEAHNVRDWKTVPASCEGYVGHYMLGGHYRRDSKLVIDQAISYVDSLKLAGNGKEVWVFDVDETTLSNLPYYATHGFGYVQYTHILYTPSVRKYLSEKCIKMNVDLSRDLH